MKEADSLMRCSSVLWVFLLLSPMKAHKWEVAEQEVQAACVGGGRCAECYVSVCIRQPLGRGWGQGVGFPVGRGNVGVAVGGEVGRWGTVVEACRHRSSSEAVGGGKRIRRKERAMRGIVCSPQRTCV